MAPQPDLISLFVVPFNQLGLKYAVTGAVAAVVYGEPRFTRDLDLVIDLAPADAGRLAAAFPGDSFYVPPDDVIAAEAARPEHGHFNLIHHETGLKADCYLAGGEELHRWVMTDRIRHDVGGTPVWVAPPEYVIIRKLQWHRDGGGSRHAEDIRAMLRISSTAIRRPVLEDWIGRLGLRSPWTEVTQRS